MKKALLILIIAVLLIMIGCAKGKKGETAPSTDPIPSFAETTDDQNTDAENAEIADESEPDTSSNTDSESSNETSEPVTAPKQDKAVSSTNPGTVVSEPETQKDKNSEKVEEKVSTPDPTPAPVVATKSDAQKCIGKNVSGLIAAIGQPNSRDYAPSCLGEGEDGELSYNGFTVYTYRENGVETVNGVE